MEVLHTETPGLDVQRILVTHAVLVGSTQLVPIPVLGNLAKNYFRKHLIRRLAVAEGRVLPDGDLNALAAERGQNRSAWLVLAYPLKWAFPMLFYFVDLKRAAHLASQTYHFGYLVRYAMQSRAGDGSLLDLHGSQDVNEAIQVVSREGPIKPLTSAFDSTFHQSKRALRAGAAQLARSLRRLTGLALPEQVAEAIAHIESDQEREIAPVVTCLQDSIASSRKSTSEHCGHSSTRASAFWVKVTKFWPVYDEYQTEYKIGDAKAVLIEKPERAQDGSLRSAEQEK